MCLKHRIILIINIIIMMKNLPVIVIATIVILGLYFGWNELTKMNQKVLQLENKIQSGTKERHNLMMGMREQSRQVRPVVGNRPQFVETPVRIPLPIKRVVPSKLSTGDTIKNKAIHKIDNMIKTYDKEIQELESDEYESYTDEDYSEDMENISEELVDRDDLVNSELMEGVEGVGGEEGVVEEEEAVVEEEEAVVEEEEGVDEEGDEEVVEDESGEEEVEGEEGVEDESGEEEVEGEEFGEVEELGIDEESGEESEEVEEELNSDEDYVENTITKEESNKLIHQHYMNKTNNQLRQLLKKHNQSIKGNKDSLVTRVLTIPEYKNIPHEV